MATLRSANEASLRSIFHLTWLTCLYRSRAAELQERLQDAEKGPKFLVNACLLEAVENGWTPAPPEQEDSRKVPSERSETSSASSDYNGALASVDDERSASSKARSFDEGSTKEM